MKNLVLVLAIIGLLNACNNSGSNKPILSQITCPVTAIAIDNFNTQWIGTPEGLYKSVDGGYEKIALSQSDSITYLNFESFENILWIGTAQGLIKADIANDDMFMQNIPFENLSNPVINVLHLDSANRRWFGTNLGISLNYKEIWKTANFRVNVLHTLFAMDAENFAINSIASWDGDYFFATRGAKLYRATNFVDSVDAFSGATQWSSPYNGTQISDTMFVVFVDNQGNQWMGGKNGIQVHWGHDPKDLNAFNFYVEDLPDSYVLAINQAPDGTIWVGTRKGLAVFDGTQWQTITSGLPDLYITAIAFDSQGTIYVGTRKGLTEFNP